MESYRAPRQLQEPKRHLVSGLRYCAKKSERKNAGTRGKILVISRRYRRTKAPDCALSDTYVVF
jgi:hypothetical protein